MIPNDFGLIRQKNHTLIALLFPAVKDIIQDCLIEKIDPDYLAGYMNASGRVFDAANRLYATLDVGKYDYIIAPVSTVNSVEYITGLRTSTTGSISSAYIKAVAPVVPPGVTFVQGLFKIAGSLRYLVVNIDNTAGPLPLIGIKKHRSDNVNPKGINKDAISDILQTVKEDELNGEADRIRNDLSGNAESSDLDSKSGSGADERAGSQAGR